jgi:hypothetical protein
LSAAAAQRPTCLVHAQQRAHCTHFPEPISHCVGAQRRGFLQNSVKSAMGSTTSSET